MILRHIRYKVKERKVSKHWKNQENNEMIVTRLQVSNAMTPTKKVGVGGWGRNFLWFATVEAKDSNCQGYFAKASSSHSGRGNLLIRFSFWVIRWLKVSFSGYSKLPCFFMGLLFLLYLADFNSWLLFLSFFLSSLLSFCFLLFF